MKHVLDDRMVSNDEACVVAREYARRAIAAARNALRAARGKSPMGCERAVEHLIDAAALVERARLRLEATRWTQEEIEEIPF